ncbi:MAG: DEAD/DEAH box helicase family protein [Steroidobacteraceae bacterium]|jgi:type III restriction enzyme|nr:DEAD/DEAH box helicase family protein [Steroidobacteraceae bacterium]
MRLLLKEFQEDAVTKLVRHLRLAAKESKRDDQAVSLASTTGSGKTVMLTAAIELILQGDDEAPPMEEATFLWITDQPELNEQTRKKMLATSSILDAERLVVIDTSFSHEVLRAGAVHFLNIQKLGKDKGLVTPGDGRTFTIWEVIKNTVDARPGKFFVILDEAHRGMIEDKGAAEATTIVQKFIKGSAELPPVPIVVGISATPERFNRLIVGTNRASRPVNVDVTDVRASGLIKETIVLHHPRKDQPTDMTMLREAARALRAFAAQWAAYCAAQEEFTVLPLLVVQVEDSGGKGRISETDIAQGMKVIRDAYGTLTNDAFAHAFQEGTALSFGGEDVRYLAPSEIQNDADVRVVFFKTSLNTGWDCPRAEVMMSFRAAADSTYIAQLVGRMVRTPLARRIVDNEVLNTVSLYLPHYDAKGLERVVAKLSKPDEGMPPVSIEESDDLEELQHRKGAERAFAALEALPSYIVPRPRKSSQVRRLMKLARLLAFDAIDEDAVATAKDAVLRVLNAEHGRLKNTARFKAIVEERAEIEIEAVNWDVGTDVVFGGTSVKVNIASENIEDLFEATGRKLNEGLHKDWWRERVRGAAQDRERAKVELFALGTQPEVIARIEAAAQALVQKWLRAHGAAMGTLGEERRALYDEVKHLAADPELTDLVYPSVIQVRQGERGWPKHLYADANGEYHADFNAAECEVLDVELANKSVVGWLRNTDRKPWALCIPYDRGGEKRPTYPDFLLVRSRPGGHVVDIIEPHEIAFSDAPEKAAGYANFAAKHFDKFGRIELILIDGKTKKRLDLTDEKTRNQLRGVTLKQQLKQIIHDA